MLPEPPPPFARLYCYDAARGRLYSDSPDMRTAFQIKWLAIYMHIYIYIYIMKIYMKSAIKVGAGTDREPWRAACGHAVEVLQAEGPADDGRNDLFERHQRMS